MVFWPIPSYAAGWYCGPQQTSDDSLGHARGPVTIEVRAIDDLRASDQPEIPLRLADIAFPPEATNAALNWFRAKAEKGPVFVLSLSDQPDEMGRIPVILSSSRQPAIRQSWQRDLLSNGLAIALPDALPDAGVDISVLISAEARAIAQQKGIWGRAAGQVAYRFSGHEDGRSVFEGTRSPFAENAIGFFAIVDGEIASVEQQEWRSYLNFGADVYRDFTISIDKDMREIFVTAGDDPGSWIGSKIRVRGQIENRGGPYITLKKPSWLCRMDE